MKGRIRILVCDGTPTSAGVVIDPAGIELPAGTVPVTLDGNPFDLATWVGSAKLHLDAGVVFADVDLLAHKLPEPARMVLYPVPLLVAADWSGRTVRKSIIRGVSLSIEKSLDPQVDTIGNQGIKP